MPKLNNAITFMNNVSNNSKGGFGLISSLHTVAVLYKSSKKSSKTLENKITNKEGDGAMLGRWKQICRKR